LFRLFVKKLLRTQDTAEFFEVRFQTEFREELILVERERQ